MVDPLHIAVTDDARWGMSPVVDEEPFQFGRRSELFRSLLEDLADRIPHELIVAYNEAHHTRPLTSLNWRLGCALEWWAEHGKAPTYEASFAVACALGISKYAMTLTRAYGALIERAMDPTLPWDTIAESAGLKKTKLFELVRTPNAKELVERLRENDEATGTALGPATYPGAEWINPIGENGWREEVEHIAQDVIYRAKQAGRHMPSDLRRVVYVLVLWHALNGAPLGGTMLKALAEVMGLRNRGEDRDSLGRFKGEATDHSMKLLAELDAVAKRDTGSILKVYRAAKLLGVKRPTISRWRDHPSYQGHLAQALARA